MLRPARSRPGPRLYLLALAQPTGYIAIASGSISIVLPINEFSISTMKQSSQGGGTSNKK